MWSQTFRGWTPQNWNGKLICTAPPCLWLGLRLPTFLDEKWTMVNCPTASKCPDVWHGDLACEWLTKLLHFSSRHFGLVQRQPLSPALEVNPAIVGRGRWLEVKTKRKVWILNSFPDRDKSWLRHLIDNTGKDIFIPSLQWFCIDLSVQIEES